MKEKSNVISHQRRIKQKKSTSCIIADLLPYHYLIRKWLSWLWQEVRVCRTSKNRLFVLMVVVVMAIIFIQSVSIQNTWASSANQPLKISHMNSSKRHFSNSCQDWTKSSTVFWWAYYQATDLTGKQPLLQLTYC